MGALTLKLAFAGIRARRVQCVLSILVVAAAATALTIALAAWLPAGPSSGRSRPPTART